MSKRIRTVKPALWEDAKLGRLDAVTRLTYVGLISMANDYGKFRADAEGVKAFVHARDRGVTVEHVEGALTLLVEKGLVELYGNDDEWFGRFPDEKFSRHQRIDRPGKDELPNPGPKYPLRRGFDESSTSARRVLDEHSTGEGKGREEEVKRKREKPDSAGRTSGPHTADIDAVLTHFDTVRATRPGSRALRHTADRKKAVRERLKDGFTVDELKQAATTALNRPDGWVWETGNATPEHVYRPKNVERYLETASKPSSGSAAHLPVIG